MTFAYDDNKYTKICTELSGEPHTIHTTYVTEDGEEGEITSEIKPGGRDDKLLIKALREINDDFHDANKMQLALNSTILEKLVA